MATGDLVGEADGVVAAEVGTAERVKVATIQGRVAKTLDPEVSGEDRVVAGMTGRWLCGEFRFRKFYKQKRRVVNTKYTGDS